MAEQVTKFVDGGVRNENRARLARRYEAIRQNRDIKAARLREFVMGNPGSVITAFLMSKPDRPLMRGIVWRRQS